MSKRKFAETLLDDLSKLIGFKELKFNENHCCNLVFDEKVTVEIAYIEDDQSIVLSSVLGIPEVQDPSLYMKLLHINMHWKELGVFTALDRTNGSIVQFREVPLANMNFDTFQLKLESFVSAAEDFITVIEQVDLGSESKDSFAPNLPSDMHFMNIA